MAGKMMTPTLAAEFNRLTAELPEAHKRLDAAFRTDPPGDLVKDAHLSRYLAEAQKVIAIVRRIEEIKAAS
jgi:hypothetical protein